MGHAILYQVDLQLHQFIDRGLDPGDFGSLFVEANLTICGSITDSCAAMCSHPVFPLTRP
ncbi:TPA: hypothetical protein I8273_004425 [Aeromonas hydrophila]|nr:hypothetical protein [Aeromonas hydrophila]HAT2638891.1 hypothetical protein [Aeromonas hydrophila]HAT3423991.1 hypothetical protein [Aeromonas hydrophila]HAT3534027.1 hypothetical protein [Aeromonas hydrophila]